MKNPIFLDSSDSQCVLIGGGWNNVPWLSRVSFRNGIFNAYRGEFTGFRLFRSQEES